MRSFESCVCMYVCACMRERESHRLVVFGQSQCTVPVGQSEQTVLVRRRDFVENEEFERGGAQRTYNSVQYFSIKKNYVFF